MQSETKTTLLYRLQQKDKSALKQLFDEQYIPVCSTINRIIKNKATTEDLAQDLFIRFWNKIETLQIEGEIPPYLRRMAINEALGYLRKTKKQKKFNPTINTGKPPPTQNPATYMVSWKDK